MISTELKQYNFTMTTKEQIIHIISETNKLYPTMNLMGIFNMLHINEQSTHVHSSDEWLLGKVKAIYKIIKQNQNGQISKNN
jgi:hypothetical protein